MRALDWKKFIQNHSEIIEDVPERSITWSDMITGTNYYIKEDDYNNIIGNLFESIEKLNYQSIIKTLKNDAMISNMPWRSSEINENLKKPLFIDVVKLYVLFALMLDKVSSKDRKEVYKDFVSETYNYKNAYKTINYIINEKIPKDEEEKFKNIKLFLVKGGAFKVKKYYLENNKLKDMRGASTILTYVTEEKIPEIIEKLYVSEAIIYSSGGNTMCILPDEELAINACCELETSFNKYTLTAENAFSYCKCTLYDLISDYKNTTRNLESKIEDRKKLKIYNNITPISQFEQNSESIKINGEEIHIRSKSVLNNTSKPIICESCNSRNASYVINSEEGKTNNVCGSCLHKNIVGSHQKLGYYREFKEYIKERYNNKEVEPILFKSIDKIASKDKNEVAIIYGDGNNIGAIVQNIGNIFEMMYFSKKMQNAASKAVYESIYKSIKSISNFGFEIIAVGGDDIFLIVPADKALAIGRDLINIFNNQFLNMTSETIKYNVTMSIGMAISKSGNDIRKLIEIAENELKLAKNKERELYLQGNNSGSISIAFVKGAGYLTRNSYGIYAECIKKSMVPMGNETYSDFLKVVYNLKRGMKNKISQVRTMLNAVNNMELSEFLLFYLYNEAKNNNVFSKILDRSKVKLYEFDKGVYKAQYKNTQIYSPWNDFIDFWNYVGGDMDEKNI